jgi:hypothetical protein
MRTLIAVLICVVLLPAAISNPERTRLPTVSADTLTVREVRRGSDIGAVTELGDSRDTLLVERPLDAREGAQSSVFVVDDDGVLLRRILVAYGRGSPSLIQIVSGVSAGDRIVVSDMRAWDAFGGLRLVSVPVLQRNLEIVSRPPRDTATAAPVSEGPGW